jgi:hypothetical protein
MTKKRKKGIKEKIYREKGEIRELSVIGHPARTGSRRGSAGAVLAGKLVSFPEGWWPIEL